MISVIIPSYNRYDNMINAINSVKNQTFKDFEIIVISDGSTDERYQKDIEGVNMIRLPESSIQKLGYPCGSVPRNRGLEVAKGEYICFLDDDDIWMPNKLEKQIKMMKDNDIDISCTDGYIGKGFYNSNKKYQIYNKEYYWENLKSIYKIDFFPNRFNLNFIKKHNCIITSSICFKKTLSDKIGFMKLIKNGGEKIKKKSKMWKNGGEKIKKKSKMWQDWDYWIRMLEHTDCLYINEPLFYYDLEKY